MDNKLFSWRIFSADNLSDYLKTYFFELWFFWNEFKKLFIIAKGKKIGLYLEGFILPYYLASVSTRLRAYDLILLFNKDSQYLIEIYKPWKRYDLVIFFDRGPKAFRLAQKLKKSHTKIILDINVNLYEERLIGKGFFKKYNRSYYRNLLKFTRLADAVFATSEFLKRKIGRLFKGKAVFLLPENLPKDYFRYRKTFSSQPVKKLLYCGYSVKAPEIMLIKEILEKIGQKRKLELIFICEKNPKLYFQSIKTIFIKYNQRRIICQLLKGDVFITPRDLSNQYNLGHSFTKIGLPMALGIPVLASPIPSYQNSAAVLIEKKADWKDEINQILDNKRWYQQITQTGIEYCQSHFSEEVTKSKYQKAFSTLLLNE